MKNGRVDRSAKHAIIGANLGCNDNLKYVKNMLGLGIVSKEDYGAALRAYQAAVDATKSVERDAADAANAREIARAKELGIDLDA